MKTPERTTAAEIARCMTGRVTADGAALQWPSLYVRRFQFPRVVDRFLVPATPEPHISCGWWARQSSASASAAANR